MSINLFLVNNYNNIFIFKINDFRIVIVKTEPINEILE